MTTYHPVKGDAADVAFCTEYVEAAYLGEDSAYRYLETMRDSFARQATQLDAAVATERAKGDGMQADAHGRGALLAAAKAEAYADAIRVLDIAADAASRAYQRTVQP